MLPRDWTEWLREHISYGHVALFLGAGFSADAINRVGHPIPTGNGLAQLLWTYLEYAGDWDGTDLATMFEAALRHKKGHAALGAFLQTHLFAERVPDWYSILADFPWATIFTTNVDNVVEIAWERTRGRPRLRCFYAPEQDYRQPDPFLTSIAYVKLHGCLTRGVTHITFAHSQYGRRLALSDPWYDHFVRVYATTPTIFVGSNLNEPLFWQYLEVRQGRGHGGENRPRCPLVKRQKARARRSRQRAECRLLAPRVSAIDGCVGDDVHRRGYMYSRNPAAVSIQFHRQLGTSSGTSRTLWPGAV
jgi:hypothetical protein